MASAIFGVDYALQWRDFQVLTTPPPGKPFEAQTTTSYTTTGGNITSLGTSKNPMFTVSDDLVARVFVDPASWRLASASNMSGDKQVWLIKHEQGHYDITALLVRDYFWRIRSLMGTPTSSSADLQQAMTDHAKATIDRMAQLNLDYDSDTQHSVNGTEQWNWWCAIQRARQLHRSPLEKGADGRYLRVELRTALRNADLGD